MVSSSKKKGSAGAQQAQAAPAPPPPPTMGTSTMPDGSNMQYFANPTEVPQSGGLVLPRAGPGMMQGVGLNMYTPPPPPPPPQPQISRAGLAGQIQSGRGGAPGPQVDLGRTQTRTYGKNSR